MERLTWDVNGFYVEGERRTLVSGEFHYYRVHEKDWRERLARFQESGGNMAATYIPWCVHEPREGEYCFDDVPGRNLTAFLKLWDLYDYQAPISADNQVRPTYQAVEACTEFVHTHSWMQGVSRYYDVQLGFSWSSRLSPLFGERDKAAVDYLTDGLHFALTGAGFQPRYRELCGSLDISRPLVIACGETMEEAGQRCVVEFLKKGGNVVLGPLFPYLDERGNPCRILKDYVKAGEVRPVEDTSKALLSDGTVIYGISRQFTCEGWEEGLLYSERKGVSIAGIRQTGAGRLLFLGTEFDYMYDSQNLLVTYLLGQLGCRPSVQCSNPNLWTTLWSDGTHGMLFAVNLFSGAQQAEIRGTIDGASFELGRVTVPAMCVLPVEWTEQMQERKVETAGAAGGSKDQQHHVPKGRKENTKKG